MAEVEKIVAGKPVEKTIRAPKAAPAAKADATDAFQIAASFDVPEVFRDVAEKSVKQAKDGYEKLRTAAEEATDLLEDQFETARTGFVELNGKVIEAAKANADATFRFAKDILAVKSFAEAIELQTAYARNQFELASAQAKDLQEFVQKYSTEASQPLKDAFGKFVKDARAA
ncbi:phasin [Chthonobacter albigriseus]|uniref:phasin n=1 Tax=Chthonobacter albigriseus TaxID=1683161 RepID=UPI0015EE7585|nr:phasin [Chthonobacter albigriseus]